MKRKVLTVVAVVLVVLVVLVVAVPLLINADRFRPLVQSQLSQALNRQVEIGSLDFSWLAGGVSARDLKIGDDPAFSTQPFLTAKALDVSVELMPLLFNRELHVRSVIVREPQVRLQEKNGRWNLASIGPKTAAAPGKAPSAAPATVPGGTSLSLQKLSITGATVVVQSPGASQTYSNLNLEATNISPTTAVPFTLAATTPGAGSLKMEGTVGPAVNLRSLPAKASLNLEHLNLGQSGYFGRNAAIAGIVDFKAALRSDGRTAHVEGTTTANKLQLVKGGSAMSRPVGANFVLDYDLNSDTARLSQGDLHIGKTPVRVSGTVDARSSPPVLNLALATQGFPTSDVQDVLPAVGVALPAGVSLQGGSATTTLAAAGPADRLVITGPLKLTDVVLSGFDLGANLRAIASLAGINTGRDTRVQSLDTRLRVAPEGITLSDVNAVIVGMGTLTGNGNIAADRALNFRMIAHLAKGGGILGGLLKQTGVGQLSTVPFRIEGTTSNPRFVPDMGAIIPQKQATGTSAQPAQNPLGDVLNLFKKK